MIYLDYTATTPIDEEVLEAYLKCQRNFFANTSSLHKLGQMSNYMFEKASTEIKEVLNISNHNIVYTANATEANNLGILGIISKYNQGKIITTKIEHPSVFEVFKNLEKKGFEIIYLDVDENGIINMNQLIDNIDKNTILISIMWVNNIVGAVQPIKKIIEIIKKHPKVKLHVDGVQGICKIIPDFKIEDIDLFTFSGHKIYAPKGIGVLAYKNNLELEKHLYGSKAQYGVKPGTVDLALPVALCKALKIYYPKIQEHYEYVNKLNKYLKEKLALNNKIVINSKQSIPYIINISLPNVLGETVLHYLEEEEIYVSTGSACSSKLKKPEKTILAMTNSHQLATTSIRISLSHLTTKEEIDKLIAALEKITNV